jgi:hypothetical protein
MVQGRTGGDRCPVRVRYSRGRNIVASGALPDAARSQTIAPKGCQPASYDEYVQKHVLQAAALKPRANHEGITAAGDSQAERALHQRLQASLGRMGLDARTGGTNSAGGELALACLQRSVPSDIDTLLTSSTTFACRVPVHLHATNLVCQQPSTHLLLRVTSRHG